MWCVELAAGDTVKVGGVSFTLTEKTGKRARVIVTNDSGEEAKLIPRTNKNLDSSETIAISVTEKIG